MGVEIVADTTHYLPAEMVAELGLHSVSLYVNFGPDRQEREVDITDLDAFYDELRTAAVLPTTSQPSVGDFLAVYEPLIERGDDIVSVHLAGALSGTVDSAARARQALVDRGVDPARIEVVDARTCAAGSGIVAMAAVAAARRGASAAETAEAGRHCREDLQFIFALDTLEFLRRGGRIGAASAYLGTALKIKPILTFEDQVRPIERVRTAGRAFERLVSHLQSRRDDGCDAWVVQHVQAPEQAAKLVERGREIYGCEPEFVSEIGPVIGTHAGPGLIGVLCTRRSRLAGLPG